VASPTSNGVILSAVGVLVFVITWDLVFTQHFPCLRCPYLSLSPLLPFFPFSSYAFSAEKALAICICPCVLCLCIKSYVYMAVTLFQKQTASRCSSSLNVFVPMCSSSRTFLSFSSHYIYVGFDWKYCKYRRCSSFRKLSIKSSSVKLT
jgi:hypothetical protein